MDFSVSTAELCRAMAVVSGCVEKRTTIPILSNVKLRVEGSSLFVSGTDLDVAVDLRIDAVVGEPGAITVPAKKLNDYIRLLSNSDVTIKTTDKSWVSITSGRAKTRMAGISAESFPETPAPPDAAMDIPAGALMKLIKRVDMAISKEESRFTLRGALLECREGKLNLVATDGHRLAIASMEFQTSDVKFILPSSAIRTLPKLVKGTEHIRLSYDDNHLFFRVGDALLLVRKTVGTFPDYSRVLPKPHAITITAKREDFTGALSRVALFTDERSRCVRVSLKQGLEVSAKSDVGEGAEVVPCDFAGKDLSIGFNAGYLLDFMSACETENVVLLLTDDKTAGELRPAGAEDYRYIVMPMRLG